METAQLQFKSPQGEKMVELTEGLALFAGRTLECDICLPSPSVSRKHAVFVMRGGCCGVKDLDSSNGTFVNGERLAKPVRLHEGDVIQIGDYSINFSIARAPSFGDAEQTVILPAGAVSRFIEPALVRVSMPAPAGPGSPPGPEPEQKSAPEPEPAVLPAARDKSTRRLKEAAERSAASPPEDTGVAAIARDSLRLRLQTPAAPKSETVILDEEVGDGAADEALVRPEEAHGEEARGELALTQAAAEAGLVGEFAPPEAPADDETAEDGEAADDDMTALIDEAGEDEDAGGSEADPDAEAGAEPGAPAEKAGSGPVFNDLGSVDLPPPREVDPNAIPVDQAFRDAVEARLFLYSFLNDMQKERKELLSGLSVVPDAVAAELDRQDREMQKIPPPEKAEQMIEARMTRRAALKEKIAEAKKNGAAMPPRPSKAMRQSEDIAINQWTIIAQSGKEALPAAIKEGFRVASSEPLAGILGGAGIDPSMLMGGGAYYLALEQLGEETKYNRAFLKAKLAQLPDPEEKKAAKAGGGGLGGLFGKKKEEAPEEDGGPPPGAAPGETYGELRDAEEHMAARAGWIAQELGSLEPVLIKEYWAVYTKAAAHFLQRPGEITLALRAFLRHGVIGFMPWWMTDEVREHVMADCSKEVVESMKVSRDITNILYADEYLAAVLHNECTPAMDENLEINAKNSPEWKADKALRKLINTRSQMKLLNELIDSLRTRIDGVEKEGAALDGRIKALLPGQKNFKQIKSELGMQRQAIKVESSKLSKLADKIRDETMAQLKEVETDTEARFDSGELPRPTPEFLIEREVDAVRKIGRLLANLKERFMPLVMRDLFKPGTDGVNDRAAIQGEIADIERRDPRIFLETMVESKKKANRVDLRISPVIVLVPSAGILAFSWNPRQKPEDGRLAIPTCFIRQRLRERQMTYLMSDFRWDTSKANAGMDVMASETIVAAFMGVRWDWRKRSKEGREKGLVYTDQNDRTNWRRVYEAYMSTAFDSGKKLFNRNYDFYERIIGKYFDPPEGVELLRK